MHGYSTAIFKIVKALNVSYYFLYIHFQSVRNFNRSDNSKVCSPFFDKLNDLIDYVRHCDNNFEHDKKQKIWILQIIISIFFLKKILKDSDLLKH